METQLMNACGPITRKYNFRSLMREEIPKMDYLSHNIHPYTAKLIPQIPRYFMKKYMARNSLIFDPFCGSGTSLLEAICQKGDAVGIDLNPLAVLISRVKTTPIDTDDLRLSIDLVKNELKKKCHTLKVEFPNKNYWFCREAQEELSKIRGTLEHLSSSLDKRIQRFLSVCFSSVIRKSSYADPRIAKVYKSKRVHKKIKNGWVPTPIKYFSESLDRNIRRVESLTETLGSDSSSAQVLQGDARNSSRILMENGIEKADFVITSPPYINAQDYYRSYKLEIWWLGLTTPEELRQLNKRMIGRERISEANYDLQPRNENKLIDNVIQKIWRTSEKRAKKWSPPDNNELDRERRRVRANRRKAHVVNTYFENMETVFEELNKVLAIGGLFCLVSGNNTICGVQIPTYKIFISIAANHGFELIEAGCDEIANRSLAPNRNHNCGVIAEEWITIFQKK